MTDIDPYSGVTRARYLEMHGLTDGTPEAADAWSAKLAFRPARASLYVMGDLPDYQAMGTDVATGKAPVITSRSQHREYLRRNGYVEVGNEKFPERKPLDSSPNEIARDVKRVIEQRGIRL